MLAGQYADRTGDWALIRELWPAIERALAWLDGPGDSGWRRLHRVCPRRPHRSCQSGLEGFARFHLPRRRPLGRRSDRARGGAGLRLRGAGRRLGVRARHWACTTGPPPLRPRPSTCAAASKRHSGATTSASTRSHWTETKSPCRVRTSNPGHALFSRYCRIPSAARALRTSMLESDFYSGWGMRTVARGEARYNPMSYHNGSVWPHDNAMVARGFCAGTAQSAASSSIFEGLMRATSYLDQRRIPELFCGFRRRPGRGPDALPGRVLAAGLGSRRAVLADPVDARPRVSSRRCRGAPQQPGHSSHGRDRSPCAMSGSATRPPILSSARASAMASLSRCCARAAACASASSSISAPNDHRCRSGCDTPSRS